MNVALTRTVILLMNSKRRLFTHRFLSKSLILTLTIRSVPRSGTYPPL